MNPELEAPLRKAISFLESRGYKYAIIGGIALSQRDYARFTYLDHSYVLFWVSQIAEALEKPELLITYKRLVAGLEVLSRSGRRKQPKS